MMQVISSFVCAQSAQTKALICLPSRNLRYKTTMCHPTSFLTPILECGESFIDGAGRNTGGRCTTFRSLSGSSYAPLWIDTGADLGVLIICPVIALIIHRRNGSRLPVSRSRLVQTGHLLGFTNRCGFQRVPSKCAQIGTVLVRSSLGPAELSRAEPTGCQAAGHKLCLCWMTGFR